MLAAKSMTCCLDIATRSDSSLARSNESFQNYAYRSRAVVGRPGFQHPLTGCTQTAMLLGGARHCGLAVNKTSKL
eukprot:6206606-Pleurochrysis_carterae.AAC.2